MFTDDNRNHKLMANAIEPPAKPIVRACPKPVENDIPLGPPVTYNR